MAKAITRSASADRPLKLQRLVRLKAAVETWFRRSRYRTAPDYRIQPIESRLFAGTILAASTEGISNTTSLEGIVAPVYATAEPNREAIVVPSIRHAPSHRDVPDERMDRLDNGMHSPAKKLLDIGASTTTELLAKTRRTPSLPPGLSGAAFGTSRISVDAFESHIDGQDERSSRSPIQNEWELPQQKSAPLPLMPSASGGGGGSDATFTPTDSGQQGASFSPLSQPAQPRQDVGICGSHLADWQFYETGGSNAGKATFVETAGGAVLTEGDSHVAWLAQTITIPNNPGRL